MAGALSDFFRRVFGGAPSPRPPERPFFRFNPGAYEAGRAFEASSEPCDVCGRPCEWRYIGGLHIAGDEPVVCAWCLADGRLQRQLGRGRYHVVDAEMDGADEALAEEALERTPGFSTFNPFAWPVLDGRPLAFIGYGDEPSIWGMPEARAAIEAAYAEMSGEPLDGPTPYGLVFRDIDSSRYVAVIDLD